MIIYLALQEYLCPKILQTLGQFVSIHCPPLTVKQKFLTSYEEVLLLFLYKDDHLNSIPLLLNIAFADSAESLHCENGLPRNIFPTQKIIQVK